MKLSEVLSSPEKWCKGIRQDDKGRCCLMGALSLKRYGTTNMPTETIDREPLRQAIWNYIEKIHFNTDTTRLLCCIHKLHHSMIIHQHHSKTFKK